MCTYGNFNGTDAMLDSNITEQSSVSMTVLMWFVGLMGTVFIGMGGWILKMKGDHSDDVDALQEQISSAETRIAVVESRHTDLVADLTEIKADVKEILKRGRHA